MCCALRSAGCSGMCAIWRAARRRAGTGSASSWMPRPAAARRKPRWRSLSPQLALGISRVPMSRQIGLRDVSAVAHVGRRAAGAAADVLHGHGAKGGAYARLAGNRRAIRAYTPHGGSLHYRLGLAHGLRLSQPRAVADRTDRSVPVRERLWARRFSRQGRQSRRIGARGAQRRHGRRVRAGRDRSAGDRSRLRGRIARAQGRRRADRGDRATWHAKARA